jgi:hypothetical protein
MMIVVKNEMLIIFVILISETVVIPFTFRNAKDHVV